jgi:hypothetical protein
MEGGKGKGKGKGMKGAEFEGMGMENSQWQDPTSQDTFW